MSPEEQKRLEKLGAKVIVLPNLMNKDATRSLEVDAKQWALAKEAIFVLDFSQAVGLTQGTLSILVQFKNNLKKVEKTLFAVNVSKIMSQELIERGLDKSFEIFNSVSALEQKLAPKPSASSSAPSLKVDANVLRHFVDAASKAFEVQVGVKLKPQKFESKKYLFETTDAVSGSILVDTKGFKGTITICFSKESFIATYKALLAEDITEITDEAKDAAGELINIIYGQAKTVLNSTMGLDLKPVIPVVQLNPAKTDTTGPVIVVPFESDLGKFRIEIHIQ